jgi:hypothetical protein
MKKILKWVLRIAFGLTLVYSYFSFEVFRQTMDETWSHYILPNILPVIVLSSILMAIFLLTQKYCK